MKVKKRSLAVLVLITALLLIAMSCVSGCVNHLEDEVVIGDFVCQEWSDGTIHLKNLSEEGKKKKYIVVPEELDGRKVVMLGYRNAVFSPGSGCWESENLKKVYILGAKYAVVTGIFEGCVNLNNIILVNNENIWVSDYTRGGKKVFIPSLKFYLEEVKYENLTSIFSNVSFYYNYENAPNDGYYWIDDVEDGELIDFIPENPEREGYKFEGWYKEQECINEWDFNNDRVKKASAKESYIEYKIFAKWVKE